MPVNDIRPYKASLREKYKSIRQKMPPETKRSLDIEIQSRVLSLREYARHTKVFAYVSKDIEVDTKGIIEAAWLNQKKVAVPLCLSGKRDMDFYYINSWEDVAPGAFGVLEPIVQRCQRVEDLSRGLCLVPGLSFDIKGFRLGYGKGYYDRFLDKFGGVTVGLCYSSCIQWKLPHGRYDQAVDFLLTDRYLRHVAK